MDMNTVTAAITSVGFPIVMCFVLFWYLVEQNKRHNQETDELRKTIENNTRAVLKLTCLLDKHDTKGGKL